MKKEAKIEKIYSIKRRMTRISSDMPDIMWHILRSLNVFSNYSYQTSKKIYYIPRDLALSSFQAITVQPQLTPSNTLFLVSFVGNGK